MGCIINGIIEFMKIYINDGMDCWDGLISKVNNLETLQVLKFVKIRRIQVNVQSAGNISVESRLFFDEKNY